MARSTAPAAGRLSPGHAAAVDSINRLLGDSPRRVFWHARSQELMLARVGSAQATGGCSAALQYGAVVAMEWIDLVLEEYKSLRQESLAAIDRQQRILASGTATAGVVLGLGANAPMGSTLSGVLLVGLGPLLALLVTVMWLGEVERMVRAGAYVSRLESRVNRTQTEPALEWESWLRREAPGGRRILWVYRAVFGILGLVALTGAVLGVIGMFRHGPIAGLACGVADVLLLGILMAFYSASEYRMRGIGGKRWKPDAVPRALRWLVGDPSKGFRDDETPVDLPAARAPRD